MKAPDQTIIFHPAAIGDTMLATPVISVLKKNFPDTKLTYWTHKSLENILLDYCPLVDSFVPYEKKSSLVSLAKTLRELNPDLFIDLSNSLRGKILGLVAGCKTSTYKKQKSGAIPTLHAVDNYIDSVRPICVDVPDQYFPTIFPSKNSTDELSNLGLKKNPGVESFIGIVPGVGNLRPHRSWQFEKWVELVDHFKRVDEIAAIIIGGPEEEELGKKLITSCGPNDINLCGKLSLTQTAAALSQCSVVITGDTGPAHIACAVGTPVIGLYGPTLVTRSGPYGYEHLCLTVSDDCQCANLKHCSLTDKSSSGKCMDSIDVLEVITKIGDVIEYFNK